MVYWDNVGEVGGWVVRTGLNGQDAFKVRGEDEQAVAELKYRWANPQISS